MSEDDFMNRLRRDARDLQRLPDALAEQRMRAILYERLQQQLTLADVLARWLRPAIAAVTLAAVLALPVTWYSWNDSTEYSLDSASQLAVLSEDPYLAAE